jgi:DUF177 domain-containing protein
VSAVIDVRDLTGRPGSSREVRISEPIPGLGTQLAEVPEDRPIGGNLLLESVVEGILVSGPLRGTMVLTCARCLKPFETAFDLEVRELFAPEATPDDDEYPLAEGAVDLEPMIRDAVLLAMPFAPLHSSDCLGLCGRCGGDRNLGECRCEPEVDGRWAPLLELNLDVLNSSPTEGGSFGRGFETNQPNDTRR